MLRFHLTPPSPCRKLPGAFESSPCLRSGEPTSDLFAIAESSNMAAGRTLRSLVSRRRRAGDEGEDEEGPVYVEDSQSEGSVLTEPDDEEEVDGGSVAGQGATESRSGEAAKEEPTTTDGASSKKGRKPSKQAGTNGTDASDVSPPAQVQSEFKAVADTEAMMNGLDINEKGKAQAEAVDFEDDGQSTAGTAPPRTNGSTLPAAERQRRDHEEYRKKRDANPAFIPNRGNFFMHDTRGQTHGPAPPQRGAWGGRGRGRGVPDVGGPFSPANQMASAERAAQQTWKHDLHDTINEETIAPPTQPGNPAFMPPRQQSNYSAHLFPKPAMQPNNAPSASAQPSVISFDSTIYLGTLQVRVKLPGMKAPVALAEAKARRYVRLPNHRPPLRRDKPVRVFLPGIQRYIFPATDRSFIFIPRQMRPNQQGYHRGYQRSIGGYGYSSRRTSMHGSMYSGSVAPSRRSSLAGVSRDRAFSPAGSFVGMPSGRPVVRLPHGSNNSTPVGLMSGYHTPTGPPVLHTYPLPQMPQFQGTPTTALHQPRPQKTISVTGIESPAILQQQAGEPQPFQNQLPAHMNEQSVYQQPPPPQPYFSPQQQYQYPTHPPAGTPLSGIPEQAMHAPNIQPPSYGQPPYYPTYPPQQGFYYPPSGQSGYPQMPMYMMPPPQGYMPPPPAPPMSELQPPSQQSRPISSSSQQESQQASQSGMVAHESNGMVFYVPASEAQSSEQHYQPAEGFVPTYAMPGLPPPTPAPDDPMQYYYPPVQHNGMQDVGPAVYYPPQQ